MVVVILTILAVIVRLALHSAMIALKAAEISVSVANKASTVAIKSGSKLANKATDTVKSAGAGTAMAEATQMGVASAKATNKTVTKGALAVKAAAVVALKSTIKFLRWLMHLLDAAIASVCAVSTIIVCIIFILFVALLAAAAAIVPLELGSGTQKVSLNGSSSVVRDEGVDAAHDGWSTKGKVSVPRYIQWYADDKPDVLAWREEIGGDWSHLPYNDGSDVAYSGCGACAASVAVSGLTGEWHTPAEIVPLLNAQGINTVNGGGGLAAAQYLTEHYGLDFEVVAWRWEGHTPGVYDCNTGLPKPAAEAADMDRVDEHLDAGGVIVMSLDNNTAQGGMNTTGHYICIYGRDSEGYYVSDSRGFTTGYEFDTPYSADQIFTGGHQGLFFYKKR